MNHGLDAFSDGIGAGQGRGIGNGVLDGGPPQKVAILFGFITRTGVDDQLNFPVFNGIHHMRPAHRDLVDHAAVNAMLLKPGAGSPCGDNLKSHMGKLSGNIQCR